MARFFCQMPIWLTVLTAGTLLASSVQAQTALPFQKTRWDGYRFTKIRIKHYDTGAMVPQKAAPNVLPEGVRRIFVLESDNSLVIEAAPEGLASLTLALSLL